MLSSISKLGLAALAGLVVIAAGCSDHNSVMAPEMTTANDPLLSTASYSSSQVVNSVSLAGRGANDQAITYRIDLVSHEYDGNNTKFTYSVTSNPDGGPAISHLTFALCESLSASDMVYSSDSHTSWGYDPPTGFTGVKFDTGYSDRETRTVVLVLSGNRAVEMVSVAVKAGNGYTVATVPGPASLSDPVVKKVKISGAAFLDINGDGAKGTDEPGIPGLTVTLTGGSLYTTGPSGEYEFEVIPGNYGVSVSIPEGFASGNGSEADLGLVKENTSHSFSFKINLDYMLGLSANGYTIGFWKTNLVKASQGKVKGTQVDGSLLSGYLSVVSSLALEPLNVSSYTEVIDILSATGSDPVLLLKKQLMGSEFNYSSGAFIGGNSLYTYCFLYQAEYMVKHSSSYSSTDILRLKDLCDAYNNSHGGAIALL